MNVYVPHIFFFFCFLKKPCFNLFILKSALYKTAREKSLRVKGVGRGGGKDDPEMKPPSHLGEQAKTGPQASTAGPLVLRLYRVRPEDVREGPIGTTSLSIPLSMDI